MEKWKKGDKVMLSTRDLVFKKRLAKKLIEKYVRLYKIDIKEYSKVEITGLYKDSSSGKC